MPPIEIMPSKISFRSLVTLGYNERPAITNKFLCIIDCNVQKVRYNEPLKTSCFFYIFLLFVSGTQYNTLGYYLPSSPFFPEKLPCKSLNI